jgi:hypothetical protein
MINYGQVIKLGEKLYACALEKYWETYIMNYGFSRQ